jgi:hypothetical protein
MATLSKLDVAPPAANDNGPKLKLPAAFVTMVKDGPP